MGKSELSEQVEKHIKRHNTKIPAKYCFLCVHTGEKDETAQSNVTSFKHILTPQFNFPQSFIYLDMTVPLPVI